MRQEERTAPDKCDNVECLYDNVSLLSHTGTGDYAILLQKLVCYVPDALNTFFRAHLPEPSWEREREGESLR